MIVLEFPPSESFRSHVRTESRYGIKGCNKKNKKNISENPDDIFSRVHNVQSAYAASWHLVWQRGYYYTTTYEWNEDPPATSRWMNAEWAVIISRKNGAKNSWKYHSFFFFCKNGHFLLQNTLILDFELLCAKSPKYTWNGTLFQFKEHCGLKRIRTTDEKVLAHIFCFAKFFLFWSTATLQTLSIQ